MGTAPAMSHRPVLVALRGLGLGELLTGLPALRALADTFPEHDRVLMGPVSLAPLLELADTGPGLPKPVAADPFRAFRKDRPGRLGLGLALAKRIAEGFGGALELQPGETRGVRALLRLPPPPSEAPPLHGS